VLLRHPGVVKLYEYEDGHILDLAAAKGDDRMVQLLLDFNMTVGPSAMAHAAHFNHTKVMQVRMMAGRRRSIWACRRRVLVGA
jgi:hypothetical protein